MQDLAAHLIAKNRKEEAIDLLLESVAIDRNWNERAAQHLLTDLLKQLGSGSEIAKKARRRLSKIIL